MLVVYLLLGGVLCWLGIQSFAVLCRVHEVDEHALLTDGVSNFLNEESDSKTQNGDEWQGSSEHEFATDWCPAELIQGGNK